MELSTVKNYFTKYSLLSADSLAAIVTFSPALFLFVLLDTAAKDAYPPEGDSLAIPCFSYLAFLYPLSVALSGGRETKKGITFKSALWNSSQHWKSSWSLLIAFYVGSFWVAFGILSIGVGAVGSFVICLVMFVVTLANRTYSIQSDETEQGFETESENSDAGNSIQTAEFQTSHLTNRLLDGE